MHRIAVKKSPVDPFKNAAAASVLHFTLLCLNSLSFVRNVVYDFMFILEERDCFGFRNRLVKFVGAHLLSVSGQPSERDAFVSRFHCNARNVPAC